MSKKSSLLVDCPDRRGGQILANIFLLKLELFWLQSMLKNKQKIFMKKVSILFSIIIQNLVYQYYKLIFIREAPKEKWFS